MRNWPAPAVNWQMHAGSQAGQSVVNRQIPQIDATSQRPYRLSQPPFHHESTSPRAAGTGLLINKHGAFFDELGHDAHRDFLHALGFDVMPTGQATR